MTQAHQKKALLFHQIQAHPKHTCRYMKYTIHKISELPQIGTQKS